MNSDQRLNRGPRRSGDADLIERIGLLEERVSHLEAIVQTMAGGIDRLEHDVRQIVELWQQFHTTVKTLELLRRFVWWCARYVALPVIIGYQLLHVAVWGKPSPGAEVVVRWLLHE